MRWQCVRWGSMSGRRSKALILRELMWKNASPRQKGALYPSLVPTQYSPGRNRKKKARKRRSMKARSRGQCCLTMEK
eukprot:5100074-Ditylum_brightwellii.AAC.1